jgi:hypothetical protein
MPFIPATVGLILTAVGTGVSVYGSYQQSQAASAVASANAKIQEKNTAMQVSSLQAQATIARQTATANFELQKNQAAARVSNAASLENRARIQESIDRVNIDKQRDAYQRLAATNRTRVATSGVVESTGTPLSIAAEFAGKVQRQLEDASYGQRLNQQGIYREAAMERLGGKLALAGASLDSYSALAQANLTDASATMTAYTGQRQADITRLAGASQAQGLQFQALGNLFSGGAQVAGDIWKFKQSGAL